MQNVFCLLNGLNVSEVLVYKLYKSFCKNIKRFLKKSLMSWFKLFDVFFCRLDEQACTP